MADDDEPDRNRSKNEKKVDKRLPEVSETCIGIWTRSARGENVNDNQRGRICNGISVVKMNKFADPKKVKQSKTRGVKVIIQEIDEEITPGKHGTESQDLGLEKRLSDVLNKQKESIEKGVKDLAQNGVKPADVWEGFSDTMSSVYKTSTRILSYCHPQEKLSQMYGFASERLKQLKKHITSDDKKK